jgi:hypothetical protein
MDAAFVLFDAMALAFVTRVPASIAVILRFQLAFVTGGASPPLRSALVKRHGCLVHAALTT